MIHVSSLATTLHPKLFPNHRLSHLTSCRPARSPISPNPGSTRGGITIPIE